MENKGNPLYKQVQFYCKSALKRHKHRYCIQPQATWYMSVYHMGVFFILYLKNNIPTHYPHPSSTEFLHSVWCSEVIPSFPVLPVLLCICTAC